MFNAFRFIRIKRFTNEIITNYIFSTMFPTSPEMFSNDEKLFFTRGGCHYTILLLRIKQFYIYYFIYPDGDFPPYRKNTNAQKQISNTLASMLKIRW